MDAIMLPSGWTRIKGAQPQKGDILVYTGGYGHVAIYESDYVTYHQNYNGKKKVTRETFAYNSPAYITNYIPYWGVVRPNFSSGNIGAYGEMTTPTIHTDKEVYNVGETANISWAATSSNSDFAQYWLVIVNETTKQKVYGGDQGVAQNPSVNQKTVTLSSAGRYYIKIYSVPFYGKESRQKMATKYIEVSNKTYTSANNVTESKPDTVKEQTYRKTGMIQAEIKKVSSKKRCLKLFLGKVTGAKGYQLQYAMNKKFKKKKSVQTKKNKYTIKKLKKKKRYYIRVRAYKMNGKKKVYGKWSTVKKVKIKK